MKKLARFALAAALAATFAFFAACSGGSSDPADSAVQDAAADLAQVSMTPQDAALASAQRLKATLQSGDLAGFYALLPASYRNDLSSVVKAYASKVDPELASLVADAVSTLGASIEKQAPHLFEMLQSGETPFEVPGEAREQITVDGIRQFGQFIGAAKSWFNPSQLAEGDISSLLASPQLRSVLKDGFSSSEEFLKAGFRLAAEQPEDSSRISIEAGSDEFGWDASDMVLVDGVWVPTDLADGWNEGIADALSGAADFEIPEDVAGQLRAIVPALKQSFATWGDASSADALTQQIMGTFMMLGALSM